MTGDPKRMRLVSFKPLVKDALRGFANVQLPNALLINDCPICISTGKRGRRCPESLSWGVMVGRSKRNSMPAMLAWPDREIADGWSEAVVALVEQQHPGALS